MKIELKQPLNKKKIFPKKSNNLFKIQIKRWRKKVLYMNNKVMKMQISLKKVNKKRMLKMIHL